MAFFVGGRMDYRAYTNESGALAADDEVERQGGVPRFKVRSTPDWKKHAAELEAEMLKRGMTFDVIDWDEGQGKRP